MYSKISFVALFIASWFCGLAVAANKDCSVCEYRTPSACSAECTNVIQVIVVNGHILTSRSQKKTPVSNYFCSGREPTNRPSCVEGPDVVCGKAYWYDAEDCPQGFHIAAIDILRKSCTDTTFGDANCEE